MKIYHFYLFLFLQCCLFTNLYAQTGEIQGKVTDAETGETLPFVNVSIDINGSLVGTTTDFDGVYSLISIPPEVYTLTFSYVGYKTVVMKEILVGEGETNRINAKLFSDTENFEQRDCICCGSYPLINSSETRLGIIITRTRSGRFDVRNIY